MAQWGILLRGSEHAGESSYDEVVRLARGALGRDEHGDRAGFVRLVQSSRQLASAFGADDDDEPVPHGH